MRIYPPTIILGERATAAAIVETDSGERKQLWYSVPEEYAAGLVPDRCDGFVVAMLYSAMLRGEDIHVCGSMSASLYHNLSSYVTKLLMVGMPVLKEIEIVPECLVDQDLCDAKGVVTGFSGGIDSLATLGMYYYRDVPDGLRLTHLIYNNVGSHACDVGQDPELARRLFRKRHGRLLHAVEDLNLGVVDIDSNLDELLDGLDFLRIHTLSNVSAVLMLQGLFKRYYYASGYNYEQCKYNSVSDIASLDPVLVPLLSTESIQCLSAGCQYSRVDKTRIVSEISLSYRSLDVCTQQRDEAPANCGVCYKCVRTLLTLELLGLIEKYRDVFDLPAYRQSKERSYLDLLCGVHGVYGEEILVLARDVGWRFSVLMRIRCGMVRAARSCVRILAAMTPRFIRKLLKYSLRSQ